MRLRSGLTQVSCLPQASQPPCRVCFSLTGVSPFAGENDRATALNVRGYNVAFEEAMFSGLCKEAKGFVIKLLVADRLYVPLPSRSRSGVVVEDCFSD